MLELVECVMENIPLFTLKSDLDLDLDLHCFLLWL